MYSSEESVIATDASNRRPMIGVVPAAGRATRWRGQLTHSKELYPVAGITTFKGKGVPVIAGLLGAFRLGSVRRAIVVTRPQKVDIPVKLLGGEDFGCPLAYVFVDASPSVPHTIAAALPFLEGCDVALGFPDIIFQPTDAIRTMAAARSEENWDVLLGLFETDRPESADMVDLDRSGTVRQVVVKQPGRGLMYSWITALWRPRFTAYLRESLHSGSEIVTSHDELHVGHLMQNAIRDGLSIKGLPIAGGRFLDLGSPEGAERLSTFLSEG